MYFVYILQSEIGDHHYAGLTECIERRLAAHNAGQVSHTSKFKPWRVQSYIAFPDRARAAEFERYLKSGSGRAFAKRHF
jgi:predicted GIY-YIG superfamily endonuclease